MGAPILWVPGKNALFLQEKPMSIKFLVLGGGGELGFWGGSANFIFMGARLFLKVAEKIDRSGMLVVTMVGKFQDNILKECGNKSREGPQVFARLRNGQPASVTRCEKPLQLRTANFARNYHIT